MMFLYLSWASITTSIMLFSLSFVKFSDFFSFSSFFVFVARFFSSSSFYDELSSISSPTSACTRGLTKKVFLAIVTRHFIYLIIEMFHRISSRLVRKKQNLFFDSSVLGTIDKTTCAGVHSLLSLSLSVTCRPRLSTVGITIIMSMIGKGKERKMQLSLL